MKNRTFKIFAWKFLINIYYLKTQEMGQYLKDVFGFRD